MSYFSKFNTKDGDEKDSSPTGAMRDAQDGKPRPDLVDPRLYDSLQHIYSGVNYSIDDTEKTIIGYVPDDETRIDLIPDLWLNRLGGLLHRGAVKYGDYNWKKGFPVSRVYASLRRHIDQWALGDNSEDHLAAIAWNALVIMSLEDTIIREKQLPLEYLDLERYRKTIEGIIEKVFVNENA